MLTKKERATLTFIQGYIKKHSIAPTVAEVAAGIGIHSRGVAYRYIKALADTHGLCVVRN